MGPTKDKAGALLHHLVDKGMTYERGLHDAHAIVKGHFATDKEAEAVIHELYVSHYIALEGNDALDQFARCNPWRGECAFRMAAKQSAIDRVRTEQAQERMLRLQYITIGLTVIGIMVGVATCN